MADDALDGLVDSDDDGRNNGPIPIVGDTLKVKGIGFPVMVTKVTESKSIIDASGPQVWTVNIKGPTRVQTTTLLETTSTPKRQSIPFLPTALTPPRMIESSKMRNGRITPTIAT